MSIENEILRIQHNIANTYAVVAEKGGEVPLQPTSANLAAAVASIPAGVGIPSGCILIWSGAADAIPDGWALCDGTNGTPDLRDRFVVGAGSAYAVGATGGEATHTLTTSEMPSHTHVQQATTTPSTTSSTMAAQYRLISGTASGSSFIYVAGSKANAVNGSKSAVTTVSKGGDAAHNNMPPYYAFCYIMKL